LTRFLLSTVRSVHDRAAYFAGWRNVRDAVTERGGHAWIFAGADDPDRFIEFIEWKQGDDGPALIDEAAVRSTRSDLDRCGSATEQLWKEAEPS